MIPFLLILVGVTLLYFGGELLVNHASNLAQRLGVSQMVIGLTVVSFTTSSPELAATLSAAFKGVPEMAIGNAFGSNIANIGLILGFSVLLYPVLVSWPSVRRQAVFMVLVTIFIYPLMRGGLLDRFEGILLLVLLAVFLYVLIKSPAPQDSPDEADPVGEPTPLWRSVGGVMFGLGLLVVGAQLMVSGAVDIATAFGISERVIGLTVVALGTSLPELAACLTAARKQQYDIVLGNVVGSNIFNLLCILGTTSLVRPLQVPAEAMRLDFWLMLGLSILMVVMMRTQRHLVRWEGGVLLTVYIGYVVYLFGA